MRGFEPEDLLEDPTCPVSAYDLQPFFFPSDEDLERVGTRGIYLSNYISWNARKQTEFVSDQLGFETAQKRDRTFNIYDKLDDLHDNGLHDYLKFLKFGYGRATDDATTEIRHGRMTREQGIEMVMKYDHIRPRDMDIFLKNAHMSEQELLDVIEPMRDRMVWEKTDEGKWVQKDNVGNHIHDAFVEEVRMPLKNDTRPFISTGEKLPLRDQCGAEQTEYVVL